jgi:predicted chitinase
MGCPILLLLLSVTAADPAKTADFPALSVKQLRAVMQHLSEERAGQFLKPLNDAMKEFEINTPKRQAAFLAQIAHESGELKYMEEIASGEAYEGRASLENTQTGDGKRYKGRGPIQLTGRGNYRKAGAALKLDLEGKPELAAEPANGCRISGWFWKTHGLNELADKDEFRQITRRINGGYNGEARREEFFKRAKDALKVTD